jgi:hypothetical protein
LPKTKLPQPILVFPNPFTNQFQTSIPIKLSNPAQIKIHNLRGELLLQKISLEPTFETETNDWPAGIYTLQVQTLDGVWVQKIIKQ